MSKQEPERSYPSLQGRSRGFILLMLLISIGGTIALLLVFMLIERLIGG